MWFEIGLTEYSIHHNFNIPFNSKSLQSLIWSVINETSSENMRDNDTGMLIFDAKNPAGIVFECRLNSPCGNIPFGVSNPAGNFVMLSAKVISLQFLSVYFILFRILFAD